MSRRFSMFLATFLTMCCLFGQAAFSHAQTLAQNGFTLSTYATGVEQAFALEFGPGGAFGTDLYVVDNATDGSRCILRIDANGTISQFVCSSLLLSAPGLAFDTTGLFGGDLFVAVDTQPGNTFGGILRVTPAGELSVFLDGRSTSPPLVGSFHLGFGNGWAFGSGLFLTDFEMDLQFPRIGTLLSFTPQAGFSSLNLAETIRGATGFAFDPLGEFGGDLFIADSGIDPIFANGTNGVVRVDANGAVTPFADPSDFGQPIQLAFDPIGRFGRNLFVFDRLGSVFQVTPQAVVSPLLTGLAVSIGDLTFGPNGDLYVADWANDRILRISADGPTIELQPLS